MNTYLIFYKYPKDTEDIWHNFGKFKAYSVKDAIDQFEMNTFFEELDIVMVIKQ